MCIPIEGSDDHVHDVGHISFLVQQPGRDLPRIPDQRLVMRFRQQKHRLHPQLQPERPQRLRQLPHTPSHVGELFLRQQARVGGSLGSPILDLILHLIDLDDVVQTTSFPGPALSLEEGVHETSGVRGLLGLLTGQTWGIKGGFAAVVVLRAENDLLCRFSDCETRPSHGAG